MKPFQLNRIAYVEDLDNDPKVQYVLNWFKNRFIPLTYKDDSGGPGNRSWHWRLDAAKEFFGADRIFPFGCACPPGKIDPLWHGYDKQIKIAIARNTISIWTIGCGPDGCNHGNVYTNIAGDWRVNGKLIFRGISLEALGGLLGDLETGFLIRLSTTTNVFDNIYNQTINKDDHETLEALRNLADLMDIDSMKPLTEFQQSRNKEIPNQNEDL